MSIFDVLSLICGLALFLFGMELMGDALKKSAGRRLKAILEKMTSNRFKGFLLGLAVTAIIQSSSATTVMVVGFVNSGAMTLGQAVGVIMGANVGTAVTSWMTGLSGIGASGEAISNTIMWLKPSSWMPILALIGICFVLFVKRGRRKDMGMILLGFSVLMVGMEMMSDSVSGLKTSEQFQSILTMFENPILGVLAGLVLTTIVQSSSASVGILQSLTTTGAITYGAAIPIVMGQNIGTCVTALISAIGAGSNGKRAALVHLYFNIIGVVFWLVLFYVFDWLLDFTFVETTVNMWGVALIHTVFKLLSVALMAPFMNQLERLAVLSVRSKREDTQVNMLDERLLGTPAIAIEQCNEAARTMAELSKDALLESLELLKAYDKDKAEGVRVKEEKVDEYEDMLGSYLVKLSSKDLSEADSREITKLLRLIGDFERISDHASDMVESAEELYDKKLEFSSDAMHELSVMTRAVSNIVSMAYKAFAENSVPTAKNVEPLEEVVDWLREQIRINHILRLQKNECTIEQGFVLSDVLTSLERVSDHCSNIAGCVIEISQHEALDMHRYLGDVKASSAEFNKLYNEYKKEYVL